MQPIATHAALPTKVFTELMNFVTSKMTYNECINIVKMVDANLKLIAIQEPTESKKDEPKKDPKKEG